MQITKLSTKGQIVIPEKIREGIEDGTAFNIVKQGDLIILKMINGFTDGEIQEMKEIDRIWKEIDEGGCISQTRVEFFKEMNSW
ncbi:MAG: AbrB/MazE/SpoVT family DNA-binding domain-containing protein [Nanoarchaeota archaeon]|nr:AbrB/MazE/SpoVT family DNA-binding domain-containing protein [Nanoarchaeota archaeon]